MVFEDITCSAVPLRTKHRTTVFFIISTEDHVLEKKIIFRSIIIIDFRFNAKILFITFHVTYRIL